MTTAAVRYTAVHPIGDVDLQRLPVKDIGPAVGYYTQVLGFEVLSRDETTAQLARDDARLGLEVNDLDPEQISCYFAVSDVQAARAELAAKGIAPSPIRDDTHDGRTYRVFFAKEPYGVCFCYGQAVE